MRDDLDDLGLGDAIVDGAGDMAAQLLAAVHGDQRGNGDQAAVALGEAGPLPDVAIDDLFGEIDQLGDKRPHAIAGVGGCFGHRVTPLYYGLAWPRKRSGGRSPHCDWKPSSALSRWPPL